MINRSLFWDFSGRFANHAISLVLSIILMRLLDPQDFGLVGIVLAIIAVLNIFTELGFNAALINRSRLAESHYNSVFVVSLLSAVILIFLLVSFSGEIARFYEKESLDKFIWALSTILIFNSINGLYKVRLTRKMQFKSISLTLMFASIGGGLAGVGLAYSGFGIWALVVQHLTVNFLSMLIYYFKTQWVPKPIFSLKAIKSLWTYSTKVLLNGLLTSTFYRLDVFILGKLFNAETLGYYVRAQSLEELIKNYTSQSFQAVLFPGLSLIKNKKDEFILLLKKYFRLVAWLSLVLSGTFYFLGEELIIVVFTDKWTISAEYFKILVIATFTHPLCTMINTALYASENVGRNLQMEVVRKVTVLFVYPVAYYYGIEWFLYAWVTYRLADLVFSLIYTNGLFHWDIRYMLKTVITPLISVVVVVFAFEYAVSLVEANLYVVLLIKLLLAGSVIIAVASQLFRDELLLLKNKLYRK